MTINNRRGTILLCFILSIDCLGTILCVMDIYVGILFYFTSVSLPVVSTAIRTTTEAATAPLTTTAAMNLLPNGEYLHVCGYHFA